MIELFFDQISLSAQDIPQITFILGNFEYRNSFIKITEFFRQSPSTLQNYY
eukprot:UN25378